MNPSASQVTVLEELPSVGGTREFSEEHAQSISNRLQEKLTREEVSVRPGPGGAKLTYLESWKVFDTANSVFGFNGWSSFLRRMEVDFLQKDDRGRWTCAATATVVFQLKDGTRHEDIGMGCVENSKTMAAALEQAKKSAVSDGVKRAARYFGPRLGNCIYDKSHLREMARSRVRTTSGNNGATSSSIYGTPSSSNVNRGASTWNGGGNNNSSSRNSSSNSNTHNNNGNVNTSASNVNGTVIAGGHMGNANGGVQKNGNGNGNGSGPYTPKAAAPGPAGRVPGMAGPSPLGNAAVPPTPSNVGNVASIGAVGAKRSHPGGAEPEAKRATTTATSLIDDDDGLDMAQLLHY